MQSGWRTASKWHGIQVTKLTSFAQTYDYYYEEQIMHLISYLNLSNNLLYRYYYEMETIIRHTWNLQLDCFYHAQTSICSSQSLSTRQRLCREYDSFFWWLAIVHMKWIWYQRKFLRCRLFSWLCSVCLMRNNTFEGQ